jgi:hypothetical protein
MIMPIFFHVLCSIDLKFSCFCFVLNLYTSPYTVYTCHNHAKMGGGNAQKSAVARERNAAKAKALAGGKYVFNTCLMLMWTGMI